MLDLCQNIWFPHIHRTEVQMAQRCRECTQQGKNTKSIIGKQHSFQMEPVVEPNEEVQLDFAEPLPGELNRDAYILVAVNKWSKFPTAKLVSNRTADVALKFMQRYISNNGVHRSLRCDQAQTFRANKFQLLCKSNNKKLLFAPVDDHRSIGVVERLIQTLKRQLGVIKIDLKNTPFKIASSVAENIKTLRITPRGVTKITPFEAHMSRKANTPLSNITTNSSASNPNWEEAKHACLDRNNQTQPPIPAEITHDLQKWSEDELCIKRRIPEPIVAENRGSVDNQPHSTTGVKTRKTVALEKERLNLGYKGIQQQTDPTIKKEGGTSSKRNN